MGAGLHKGTDQDHRKKHAASDGDLRYAELAISKPTPNGECPYPSQRKHLYAFKVKPGSSAVLVVPDGFAMLAKDGTSCVRVRAVRGREPSMLDVSIGAVMPLTESEVEGVNRDLNERYATIDPPSTYTPGRRGIEFNFTPEELFQPMNDASGRK